MPATHNYAGISATSFVKVKGDVRSWKQARDFLGGAYEKQLASNVRVRFHERDESISITLYTTDIVTYFPDGTFEANNGGHNTQTTTTRLNQFGPHGWHFCHAKKKLLGCGHEMAPGKRFKCERQ